MTLLTNIYKLRKFPFFTFKSFGTPIDRSFAFKDLVVLPT